jgi:hypothetical protein
MGHAVEALGLIKDDTGDARIMDSDFKTTKISCVHKVPLCLPGRHDPLSPEEGQLRLSQYCPIFDRESLWGYESSMKVKTSITLSEDVLHALEEHAVAYKNRSDFIEAAVWAFIKQKIRDEQNARDLKILNRRAEALNKEANDVLAYQVPV